MTVIRKFPSDRPVTRSVAVLTATLMVGSAIFLGGCRDGLRIDDFTAAELSDPEKRHPIRFATRAEGLLVEIGGKGEGLSDEQLADVKHFVSGYKSESRGRLRIAAPGSVGGHLAASRSMRQILDIVEDRGVPRRYVDVARHHRYKDSDLGPSIEMTYERQVAVAPVCGQWPENVVDNRERLPYENFGCATQRNLALTVANGRDLQGPQPVTPRSSERRSVTWTKYVKGDDTSAADTMSSGASGSEPAAGDNNGNQGRNR